MKIIIVGDNGVGKDTLAKKIAKDLDLKFSKSLSLYYLEDLVDETELQWVFQDPVRKQVYRDVYVRKIAKLREDNPDRVVELMHQCMDENDIVCGPRNNEDLAYLVTFPHYLIYITNDGTRDPSYTIKIKNFMVDSSLDLTSDIDFDHLYESINLKGCEYDLNLEEEAEGKSEPFIDFMTELSLEIDKHKDKPDINSLHEFYGLLKEEVDEAWEEIKKKPDEMDFENFKKELLQICSICYYAYTLTRRNKNED